MAENSNLNNRNFESISFSEDIETEKYQEFINLIRVFCKIRNFSTLKNRKKLTDKAQSLFKNIKETCDPDLQKSLLRKFFGSIDNEPYAETLLYDGSKEQYPTNEGNAEKYAEYLQNVVIDDEEVTTDDEGLVSIDNDDVDIYNICMEYPKKYKLYYNYFDKFHQHFLKNEEQLKNFIKLAQNSIKSGQIPEEFLLSLTYKVPKSEFVKKSIKDKDYRPLVTFDFKSLLLQRIVLERLIKQTNDQVKGLQFAYRDHYNKELLILALHQHIKKLKSEKTSYAVLFYDIRKAYNNVKHNRLLKKLKEFNIDKGIFNWLKAFLTNQKTRVCIQALSKPFIPHGIPQGSPLSPWLFVLYINSIFDLFKEEKFNYVKLFLYSDDITVVISDPTVEKINTIHNKIKNWLKQDVIMETNDKKTDYYLRGFSETLLNDHMDTNFGRLNYNKLDTAKEKLVGFDGLKELLYGETDVYSKYVDKVIRKTKTVKHACQALKEIFPNETEIYKMYIESIDLNSHILLWGMVENNKKTVQKGFDEILKEISLFNDEMPLSDKQKLRESYNLDVDRLYESKAREMIKKITEDLKDDKDIASIFNDPVPESAYGCLASHFN